MKVCVMMTSSFTSTRRHTQVRWRLVAGARSIVARECLRDGSAAALCHHSCNSGDRAWGV